MKMQQQKASRLEWTLPARIRRGSVEEKLAYCEKMRRRYLTLFKVGLAAGVVLCLLFLYQAFFEARALWEIISRLMTAVIVVVVPVLWREVSRRYATIGQRIREREGRKAEV